MCKHFKGKGTPFDIPEKCTLLKVSSPFDWKEYYSTDKCICKGIHFKPGGECNKVKNILYLRKDFP